MTVPVLPRGHDRWTMDLADAVLGADVERREVVEGELVVPMTGPSVLHQKIVMRLLLALVAARPDESWLVLPAPLDVRMSWGDVCQPDVIVIRDDEVTSERFLDRPPALVVEVLSPSTRGRDLLAKRRVYERFRVGSYWIVDPDQRTLTVLEPDADGHLREVLVSEAAAPVAVQRPFPVTITWS